MRFTVKITLSNDEFPVPTAEIVRILRTQADLLEHSPIEFPHEAWSLVNPRNGRFQGTVQSIKDAL
jgi:hypothetical protein